MHIIGICIVPKMLTQDAHSHVAIPPLLDARTIHYWLGVERSCVFPRLSLSLSIDQHATMSKTSLCTMVIANEQREKLRDRVVCHTRFLWKSARMGLEPHASSASKRSVAFQPSLCCSRFDSADADEGTADQRCHIHRLSRLLCQQPSDYLLYLLPSDDR